MPLLDHFRPPLHPRRHWESFHAAWIGSLADALNRQLPPGYFAEEQVHAGPGVEVDVATFEADADVSAGGWVPPEPVATVAAAFSDDFEVRVFSPRGGLTLVAAVELVSPRNKDRPAARRAFVAKCAGYLSQGVGLVVVDAVTDRHANLHNDLLAALGTADGALPGPERLYAAAYRPVRRGENDEIDVWPHVLGVGRPLPTLPLALNAGLCLPLDLEAAYTDACARRRIA